MQPINSTSDPGGHLNIKMPSYQYRDSHVKDKTVSPTVLSLTWESPYLGKTVFILRRGAQGSTTDGPVDNLLVYWKYSDMGDLPIYWKYSDMGETELFNSDQCSTRTFW